MSAPRITALRELAQEAELERRDFLYEATEQLRRFVDANRDRLKAFEVAGENGDCVAPSSETISDHSYPISRPLFIYVNKQKAEENKALAEFVDFYLEGLNEFVEEVGYVALPDDRVSASKTNWDDRVAGTQQEG